MVGICVTAWLAGPGLAANLPEGSRTLGANSASVGRCDTDGVTPVYTLSSGNITSVTVSGISSACGNAALALTVNNGTTSSGGSASVPAAGGSVTVTLASSVAIKDSTQTEITIS